MLTHLVCQHSSPCLCLVAALDSPTCEASPLNRSSDTPRPLIGSRGLERAGHP
jgi:hypothetical protein